MYPRSINISKHIRPVRTRYRQVLSLFLGLLLLATQACDFAPGSYPYAETYELSASEDQVKQAIHRFKQEHPEYSVPKVTIDGTTTWALIDHQSKDPDYWYVVYFYYPEERRILLTWTRPAEKGKTTFALVGINQGLTLGRWRDINKDFSGSENDELKKAFEERILKKIKEML
jgi:hypothetical protein